MPCTVNDGLARLGPQRADQTLNPVGFVQREHAALPFRAQDSDA